MPQTAISSDLARLQGFEEPRGGAKEGKIVEKTQPYGRMLHVRQEMAKLSDSDHFLADLLKSLGYSDRYLENLSQTTTPVTRIPGTSGVFVYPQDIPPLPESSYVPPPPPILPPSGFTLQHKIHGYGIARIAWSPTGQMLAFAANDLTIRIQDIENDEPCRVIKGHLSTITSIAWSPDGKRLASSSLDGDTRLWDVASGNMLQSLQGHSAAVLSTDWSPDGRMLACGSQDEAIRIWNTRTGKVSKTIKGHSGGVSSVAWPPDGKRLASGSRDGVIRLWDTETKDLCWMSREHVSSVLSIVWSPDGHSLASGSADTTIRLWHSKTGQQTNVLEGHTTSVMWLSFSSDGRFLASRSSGGVRLWRCDKWETVAALKDSHSGFGAHSLDFHPKAPVLAMIGEQGAAIYIWDLDLDILPGAAPVIPSFHYANAKVVLVGDTGVGKTGLGLVLTGQPFVPTESTHGRHIWTFDSYTAALESGREETRETLLWDLAGQSGCRLIHQLHLNEVAVALVVFDARSETDPFAGVRHWV
jgi:WD40 repeat protein